MKSVITLAVGCVIFCGSSAQENNLIDSLKRKAFPMNPLISKQLQPFMLNKKELTVTPPVSVQLQAGVVQLPLTKTWIGNNGMGADIYTLSTDKMPCLVPDKTFKSNMPVAGFNDKTIDNRTGVSDDKK